MEQERVLALYDAYADGVYRVALGYLRSAHDAEDAVQDALLSAWRALGSLRDEQYFETWLMRILINDAAASCAPARGLRAAILTRCPNCPHRRRPIRICFMRWSGWRKSTACR